MLNHWTFLSLFVDQTSNVLYGMKYRLDSTTSRSMNMFRQRNTGTSYQAIPSANVFWGGSDNVLSQCSCWLQFVRIYWDYLADSEDKMINLALMNSDSITYFVYILNLLLK